MFRLDTRRGTVISDKMNKTIVVQGERLTKDRKVGKFVKTRKKYHAHDEWEQARIGDFVEITACSPISKSKHWRLLKILSRPDIRDRSPQVSRLTDIVALRLTKDKISATEPLLTGVQYDLEVSLHAEQLLAIFSEFVPPPTLRVTLASRSLQLVPQSFFLSTNTPQVHVRLTAKDSGKSILVVAINMKESNEVVRLAEYPVTFTKQ
jgi:small subunit ribosomal protein S17